MITLESNLFLKIIQNAKMQYKRWLQRFDVTCTIFKITGEERVPYLLQYLSGPVYDNLCDNLGNENPYTKSYKAITEKLTELYAPGVLEIAETFKFNQRKPLPGEDVQDFANALSSLGENFNFCSYKLNALRNQFVCGLSSARIRLVFWKPKI